jgi:predicted DNA-binding transcriptional regulator AlpA
MSNLPPLSGKYKRRPNGCTSSGTVPPQVLLADQLPDSVLVNLPTVESLLGVSTSTVWRLSRKGLLTPIRIGGSTRWRIGEIRAFAAKGPDSDKSTFKTRLRPKAHRER